MLSGSGEKWKINRGDQQFNMECLFVLLSEAIQPKSRLKCLTDAIEYIIPDIQDATFAAQFSLRLNRPPELESMLAISQLRFKGKQPES